MSEKASADDAPEKTEDAAGEGAEGQEGKKGLNAKKIILFVVVPIFLLIGIGGGLYFSGLLDGLLGKTAAEGEEHAGEGEEGGHGKGKEKGGHGEKAEGAFFLQIPNMIVNLNSGEGQTRYLRLSVQLEVGSEADKLAVEAVMPRVVDEFQTYLRELRIKDLRGSAGIYRLQMELLSRVNAASYPVEVKDVLFQEILIQ